MSLFYACFCYSRSLIFRLDPSPYHLRLWPFLSPCQLDILHHFCFHCLRLFFSVASHPPEHFIAIRLCYPHRRDWFSFDVAFISTVCHIQLIDTSSPALDIYALFCRFLRCRRSPPPVLRYPSTLPPSPPSDFTGPHFIFASSGRLRSPVSIVGQLLRHCLHLDRPRIPFQGVYLDFST